MFEHHSDHVNVRNGESRVKVVAFGSYHSGKTSLIKAINPHPLLTEASNHNSRTTVALDLGIREHKGVKIFLYGTPGQERFEVARDVVAFGLHVGLVVVDSTRGMTGFERRVLAELKRHGVPCIVLANKTDLPGAAPDAVRQEAGGATVMPISTKTGQGVEGLLDRIVEIADGL